MNRHFDTASFATGEDIPLAIADTTNPGAGTPADNVVTRNTTHSEETAGFVVRARFRGDAKRLVVAAERDLFLDEQGDWTSSGRPREFRTRCEAEAVMRASGMHRWNRKDSPVKLSIETIAE